MNPTAEQIGYIYDIQKFSVHDGPGIRTDIFLKGCPLSCIWCHSPESQSFGSDLAWMDIRCIGTKLCGLCLKACTHDAIREGGISLSPAGDEVCYPEIDRDKCKLCMKCAEACPSKALFDTRRVVTIDECMKTIRQDTRYYEKSGGGVTISGGEPMSQFEFCLALAKQCRQEGFHVALDTTGFAPFEHYFEIMPYVNLFLYDIKHMDTGRSRKLTGVPNELILENARKIAKAGGRFQIRVPIIPKLNDSESNIKAAAKFCVTIKDAIDLVQLLPYHRMGAMKYKRLGKSSRLKNVEVPPGEFMEAQLEYFKSFGLPAQIH